MSLNQQDEATVKSQILIEEITSFLQTKNLQPKLLETRPGCRVDIQGKNFTYACYILVKYNISTILFYFIAPIRIEEKQYLLPIAEFITRANYNMVFGHFEMDFSDGEVRYKTEIVWRDTPVKMSEIVDALNSGVGMWDIYIRYLTAIIYEGITPEEAIYRLRGLEE